MAGVLDGSTHTLESHLNEFYTPEHKVDGLPDDEEESVAGSDIAAWPDPPANDVSVAGIVSLASKDGERDPTLGFTEDGADGLALDQALTSLRPKVNKMPKFAASKSGATHQERGLPQDWDGGLALDQTSTSLRPKANKMPRFAASKFGATYPEQGQPEDGDNALDQSWSLRRSSVNKIAVSKSGAAPSAWELPQDGDDSLTLDQSFSSRQSNVSKIPLNTASTSDLTDVAESISDGIDVDVGQFAYEYNPHEQNLQPYQSYMGYGNADCMGSESIRLRSNATPFVPFVRTPELHDTQRTTVVLRNIPKNLNTSRVVDWLNSAGYKGMFDFVDVPTNRVSKNTGGFAIVNLIHPAYAPFFWKTFDGFNQWTCKSRNICRVVWYEQLQGLHQIIRRYKNLIIVNKGIPKKSRPWLLNEGEWVQF